MSKLTDPAASPVWRCAEVTCGMQWASESSFTRCPFCEVGAAAPAGFTWGEIAQAAEQFGFSKIPVHVPVQVPEVVPLTTIPREAWIGLPVFHPLAQDGTSAVWVAYDVGVVIECFSDPDLTDHFRCRFVTSPGDATLIYSPENLWVPRTLAERIAAAAG